MGSLTGTTASERKRNIVQDQSPCWESALALGRRVRAGEVSAVELARVFIDAIKTFNPPLNAVVTLDEEGSLARAKEVEAQIRRGELADSPLAGVPFLAKDLDVTAGIRTTFGSLIHKDYVPSWDMLHITRLKAAGLVLLGKTNTPEDGTIPNSYNDVFGVTRNPWNLGRCSGGSSGGSGCAVAAGLAPLATGSDGSGSIRIPASINGVFGFKPTFGTIAFGPKGIGVCNTIGHLGPLTRSVADAAAMTDVMSGGDERDRASLPKLGSLLGGLDAPFRPRRIAYSADLGYAKPDADVRRLFESTIDRLRAADWPLEEAHPGFDDPLRTIDDLMIIEWGTIPMMMERDNPRNYALQTREVKELAERRKATTLEDYWRAMTVRKNVCIAMGSFFERFDLLLTPSLTRQAFALDVPFPPRRDDPSKHDRGLNSLLYAFNLTGDPACSLPMGLTDEGLPAGLQVVGPRYEDSRVLRAALEIERICPWHEMRPPEQRSTDVTDGHR